MGGGGEKEKPGLCIVLVALSTARGTTAKGRKNVELRSLTEEKKHERRERRKGKKLLNGGNNNGRTQMNELLDHAKR